jgi:YbbR domain-containing protein
VRAFLTRLTRQWQLKLLAFALAMLLWVVVSGEQLQSRLLPVPLEVRVTDPSYQLIESSIPSEVDVRFVGPGREFIEMALRRPHLILDVAEVNDTAEVFRLEPGMVQASGQNITARGVDPSRIRLRFHRRATRTVPVEVTYGPGYGTSWTLLAPPIVEPGSVTVSGPTAAVRSVDEVPTIPLRIAAGDSVVDRELELDPAALRGLGFSVGRVRVRARSDALLERTVAGVQVDLGPGLVVTPDTVSVRLRGPRSLVEALQPSELRVVVSIDSIPETIPPEGVIVPLRAESPAPAVQARPLTASARLFPRILPADESAAAADGEAR